MQETEVAAVWAKTQAGRQEIQTRSKVQSRLRRTLLLLVDGRHDDAELLAAVQGTTPADFEALEALGLIVRSPGGMPSSAEADDAPSWTIPGSFDEQDEADDGDDAPAPDASSARLAAAEPAALPAVAPVPAAPAPAPAQAVGADVVFAQTLTDVIERDLGLWGFSFTMAVERAASNEELQELAERVIAAIVDRRGEAQGEAARQALYGGR